MSRHPQKKPLTVFEQLSDYQQEAVKFSLEKKTVALFAKPGTGKTWITSAIIEQLLDKNFSALIVAPLAPTNTAWAVILPNVQGLVIHRNIDSFLKSKRGVLLLHYEDFIRIPRARMKRATFTLVVFDESQRLRARGGKASKAAAKLADPKGSPAEYRIALSGTPYDKGIGGKGVQDPQELWSQFRFVRPSLFGTVWASFDAEYLLPTGYMGYLRKFKETHVGAFLSALAPWTHIIEKDVLNLPAPIVEPVLIPLADSQRKLYEQLLSDEMLSFEEGDLTADMTVTLRGKLHEITGGTVRLDAEIVDEKKRKGPVIRTGNGKLRWLNKRLRTGKDLLPVVIFCRYTEEIKWLQEVLTKRYRVARIDGSNRQHRTEIQQNFQRGKYDVLIVQVRAGGVGIDLFRSCHFFFYSCSQSYIDFEQAIDRLHRRGQTRQVRGWLLCAEDTIDEEWFGALMKKEDATKSVTKRIKQLRKNRGAVSRASTRVIPSHRKRRDYGEVGAASSRLK